MMNEAMTATNADRMTPATTPWTKISFLFIADLYALGRFDGTVKRRIILADHALYLQGRVV
jgi:hypothetical protein